MAAESKKTITLRSSDGVEFEIEEAVAMESQTIRHMIEDNCAGNGIPIPNVNSKTLAKVIEYCKKHAAAAAVASKPDDEKHVDAAVAAAASKRDGKKHVDAAAGASKRDGKKHVDAAAGASKRDGKKHVGAAAVASKRDGKKHVDAAALVYNPVDKSVEDELKDWDADFIKVDLDTLYYLLLAANYLSIKGLLELACDAVAGMLKGKTPEEMRKTFNIINDFTPEQLEVRRKNYL